MTSQTMSLSLLIILIEFKLYFILQTQTSGICTANENLFEAYKEVHNLAPRWSDICCALNLPHEETIRKETQGDDCARCLRMVLRKWLQKSYNYQRWGCPTWRMLVEAVGDPAGGNDNALAEAIAKKHPGMY